MHSTAYAVWMVCSILGIANVVVPVTTVTVVRMWRSRRPVLQPVAG